MDRSLSIPTKLVGSSHVETIPPGTIAPEPSPPRHAISEAVLKLVRHDLNSILRDACEIQDFDLILAAIEGGADPNCFVYHPDGPTKADVPVLFYASLLGNADVVECLLRHGAKAAFWMVHEVFSPEREAVIRLLSAHVGISTSEPKNGSTLLHGACSGGDVWAVDLLLELKADVNKRMKDGTTCLIRTFDRPEVGLDCQLHIMKKLLLAGAHVDTPYDEINQLTWFCMTDNVGGVSLLLEHGANPNSPVGRHKTCEPLLYCCEATVSLEVFARMVQGGARLPFEAITELLRGDDELSVAKRHCIHTALVDDIRRPIAKQHFRS